MNLKTMKKGILFTTLLILTLASFVMAQQGPAPMKPDMTEYWEPVPKVVDPGPYTGKVAPPSDAIVLFDGKDLSKWAQRGANGELVEPKWQVKEGYFETGAKTAPEW